MRKRSCALRFLLSFGGASLCGLGLFLCAGAVMASQAVMQNFEVRTCSTSGSRCLSLKAETASGSSFRNILFFRNPKLNFVKHPQAHLKDQRKTEEIFILGQSGYLDFDMERMVIRHPKGAVVSEEIFDLKSLEPMKW